MESERVQGPRPGLLRGVRIVLGLTFAGICASPHVGRLLEPGLFSDDVIRIAQLQTMSMPGLAFRPFNEHVAPLFQMVSWVTWQLCGHRLTLTQTAFTAASLLPFVLCLFVLARLVRRETRSATAGMLAAAAFCVSAIHLEAAWWYSASSFTWALLGTMLAWAFAVDALDRAQSGGSTRGWWWAALSALAAPAFSAIGLLAGPAAVLRAGLDPRLAGRRKAMAFLPMLGTIAYLAGASFLKFHAILSDSVHQNGDALGGLLAALRAPADVLIPGLVGVGNLDGFLRGGIDIAVTATLLVALAAWCVRSPARPAIVAGLALIVGGYGLTYCVRNQYGSHWLLEVQRYHLFPQLGLVVILAILARRPLARLDARPSVALAFAAAFAGLLLVLHYHPMRAVARSLTFPAQAKSLLALEDLEHICRQERLSREDVLASLPSVRPRWFPHGGSVLEMIAETPATKRPARDAMRIVIDSLCQRDLEALLGGMDASALLTGDANPVEPRTIARGDLLASVGVRADGPGRWRASAHRALLDFRLDGPASEPARLFYLTGLDPAQKVELWWTGEREDWTESRSVRWEAVPPGSLAIPLDRVPHWSAEHARRVRLVVRSDGPIVIESPRLLR